ncbi:40-residue YVTN family beta-propeller repeat-containing protein [Parapedobacter luteus]|uniref:40-residue YVTN family beta-propeller repeat-containing protein n=1 Tax=Parapedobacter luteus TaxID=623280 RepID=A0A1T5A436_9SPHI|nr:YncE family protein [Parapedobacter luteus]SKB29762.1 40-residue YVTN family beta-propeller repeat-containing protein [Parapedobacter luteus]
MKAIANRRAAALTITTVALTAAAINPITAQTLVKTEKIGANIYQPVVNQKDGAVFISSAGTSMVYKLDPTTLKAVDSISTPESAPMGLGISQNTQTLYTTNSRSGLVVAIDIPTGKKTIIKADADGRAPREIRVDESRGLVYASSVRGKGLWVIDAKTNKFLKFYGDLGNAITGHYVDEQNNIIYATAMGDNEVVVVDGATGNVLKKFAAHGERPTNVHYDAKGNRLFVANQTSENITVLDAETGALIKAIPTAAGALGVNYDPQRDRIFVANRHGRTVNVIDGTSLAIIKTFEIGALPNTVAINHQTGDVYITNKEAVRERGENAPEPVPAPNADSVSLIKP